MSDDILNHIQMMKIKQQIDDEIKNKYEVYTISDKDYCSSYIKIIDKNGEKVSFNYNSIQDKIDTKVQELINNGKLPRIIVLKARQEGVSTYSQAKIISRITREANKNALVVAHRDDSTNAIFEKAKLMYNNLPNEIKPIQKASNARELIFDTPSNSNEEGLNSKIKIQTAGRSGIGRSDTHYYVHLSEFAFWEGKDEHSPLKQLSGILQSVPNRSETFVIIESTANGFNDFKSLWDNAVNCENEWTPMFFAWHDYYDYRMSIKTETERQKLLSSLNEYEREMIDLYRLSLEQIKWYRWTLKNDCNGDLNQMRQENPSNSQEAFISTGTPVFNNDKIIRRIEILKKENIIPVVGNMDYLWQNKDTHDLIVNNSINFKEAKNGDVYIYEKPKHGIPYVIGGDTKGEGHDSYTATVINNITSQRVAHIHMQTNNSKPYTWSIYCLGMYYNRALISIEINFNTAPIEELERLRYPFMYQREYHDDYTGKMQKRYGWKTDGITRPLIIDKQVSLMENHMNLFMHIPMLRECLTFVYDKNKRPDAMSGKHDDLLFSDMIAEESRNQQSYVKSIQHKQDVEYLDGSKIYMDDEGFF